MTDDKEKNEPKAITPVRLKNLNRQEILQLLLDQMNEAEQQRIELEELKTSYERLKVKLNDKDEEIALLQERMKMKLNDKDERLASVQQRLIGKLNDKDQEFEETNGRLKQKLDDKDRQIAGLQEYIENLKQRRVIELNKAGNIAKAALELNDVFAVAQRAAEQYVYNVKRRAGRTDPAEDRESIKTYLQLEEEIRKEMQEEAEIKKKDAERAEKVKADIEEEFRQAAAAYENALKETEDAVTLRSDDDESMF